jgi:hypothetical protein
MRRTGSRESKPIALVRRAARDISCVHMKSQEEADDFFPESFFSAFFASSTSLAPLLPNGLNSVLDGRTFQINRLHQFHLKNILLRGAVFSV